MNGEVPLQPPVAVSPSGAMIRALGLVSLISGFSVTLAYQWAKPYVEENQRRSTEQAVRAVLPTAVTQRAFLLTPEGVGSAVPDSPPESTVYVGYDGGGKILGIAARGAARGYADLVHLMYAYEPGCRCITSVKVVKMAETPGLGDKVTKDPAFLKNFEALDAQPNPEGTGLANPIVTVKNGTKRAPWQIDAISGSTVTSKAIGRGLDQSAQRLIPLVHKHLAALETHGR